MYQEERNVVILGKVGGGKRTLGNIIAGAEIFREDRGVVGARKPGSFFGERTSDGIRYRVLTVDTEGVQTGYIDPTPHIKRYNLEKINLIVFVIAHGRYTDESHLSLQYAIDAMNQPAKSICSLVITHCEGMQEYGRRDIAEEFRNNPRAKKIVSFMGKGIYTVGFPDISKTASHLRDVMREGIRNDTEVVKHFVNKCKATLLSESIWNPRQISRQQFQKSSTLPAYMPSNQAGSQQALLPRQTAATANRQQAGVWERLREWISTNCNIL